MKEKLLYLLSAIVSWTNKQFRSLSRPVHRILVVKLDEIGDMVTSMHIFKHLHENYPMAKIDLVCKPVNQVLFRYMPYITCYTSIPKKRTYEIKLDLRGNFHSMWYGMLNPGVYRCRGTIRFRNKLKGGQTNELITNYEIIKPLVRSPLGQFDHSLIWTDEETIIVNKLLSANNIDRYAVLHLGARDKSRRWPVERFAEIIEFLFKEFGMSSVLAGGPSDSELNQKCLEMCRVPAFDFAGKLDLLQFASLCAHASIFIGNESGPLHIASSCKIPLVALFGPGVKDVFYPLGGQVRIHHYFKDKQHRKQTEKNSTIFEISTEEVKNSIRALI